MTVWVMVVLMQIGTIFPSYKIGVSVHANELDCLKAKQLVDAEQTVIQSECGESPVRKGVHE